MVFLVGRPIARVSAIAFHGLTKDYGRGRGIFDLNLRVAPGEVFGFLGPNGAGKTTTIRLLLDLLRPTRGSATILGRHVQHDGPWVRQRVGYLPGELSMYEKLTGATLVRRMNGLRGVAADAGDDLAQRLQADLTRPIGQLSSGNKRKIGLILALAHDPEVLILDEPTTGLDPLMQREIHGILRSLAKRGKTVFLSSHFIPEVERVCDRVGIVRDGRLLVVKPLAELKNAGLRHVTLRFAGPPPLAAFQALPQIQRIEAKGTHLHLAVAGPLDAVVQVAARHAVLDLDVATRSLEDTFLDYYRRSPHA